ncbi:hypothetical protein KP509_30G044200 [Ceratopteris richardii]|uniref:Uncharacterized protein n=1 Tax=Ceratopteris richardii TaxID=49495 RepID=A0A8T2R428_CERRI|nr:hypothetical protein KP509_30G044200 [Ceratopteris richardii]
MYYSLAGNAGEVTWAKVAWETIIMPKSSGGLGIIHPVEQSKALLAKLVVRSLLPGEEGWKKLLRNRMTLCAPIVGRPWQGNIRWIFNKELNLVCARGWENNFINGVWRAWKMIRKGLRKAQPKHEEELQREPIVWNELFTTQSGKMLGA